MRLQIESNAQQYDNGYGVAGVALSSWGMKAIFPLFIGLLFMKRFNQLPNSKLLTRM